MTAFPPKVIDVSRDSLSTFSSEQELATGRPLPAPPAPRTPPVLQTVRRAERPLAPAPRAAAALRRWTALLSVLVILQAAMMAWWWRNGGLWSPPAATLAAVAITSDPAGAIVTIDGVRRGETPLSLDLPAGTHSLSLAGGDTPWSQVVELKAGQASTIHVQRSAPAVGHEAAAERGTIEITTEPPGLAVAVDGEPRGVSPISITELEPGTHEVAVTRGRSIVRRIVAADAGVPTAVLISTISPGIASGWLTVSGPGPVPVQIVENGVLVGTSDTPRLLLPVGSHDLEFVSEPFGYRSHRTVQITSGQAAAVALEPVSGTLSVNALPWGEVWIDGQRTGETPIGNLPLPIGNHDVVVRHPQLGERRRTVAVGASAPARVGIDLRQP